MSTSLDNGRGGVLPLSEWPAADAAVKAAWALHAKLSASVEGRLFLPGIGLGKDHFRGLVKTFGVSVRRFGEVAERLKHGPISDERRSVAIAEWKRWGDDFERWAKSIDSAADVSSLKGAIREVGGASLKDAADLAVGVGKGFMTLLRASPFLIAITLGVFLWSKTRRT